MKDDLLDIHEKRLALYRKHTGEDYEVFENGKRELYLEFSAARSRGENLPEMTVSILERQDEHYRIQELIAKRQKAIEQGNYTRNAPEWYHGFSHGDLLDMRYLRAEDFVRINRDWYAEHASDDDKARFKELEGQVAKDGGDWPIHRWKKAYCKS